MSPVALLERLEKRNSCCSCDWISCWLNLTRRVRGWLMSGDGGKARGERPSRESTVASMAGQQSFRTRQPDSRAPRSEAREGTLSTCAISPGLVKRCPDAKSRGERGLKGSTMR